MHSTYFSCVPTYIPCVPSTFPMHSCIYFMQSCIFSHWHFTILFPTTVMLNMSNLISLHCKVDCNLPNGCFPIFSFELYFFQSYQIQCITSLFWVWFHKKNYSLVNLIQCTFWLVGWNNVVFKWTSVIGWDHIKNDECLPLVLSCKGSLQRISKSIVV